MSHRVADLVRRQHLDADVGNHGSGFQESDDGELPVPFPDDFEQGAFLKRVPGAA
jgi:hypothetical protein